ncbi:MAG: hypothetical protein ACRCR1_00250 [Aeromonas sp.]
MIKIDLCALPSRPSLPRQGLHPIMGGLAFRLAFEPAKQNGHQGGQRRTSKITGKTRVNSSL